MDEYCDMLIRIGRLDVLLSDMLKLGRGSSYYDCLVGFSGGKDSSYILYRLKSDYDVKVLSYTLDNGFLTDYAKKNIDAMVKRLEIDHLWVVPPKSVLKEMYANNLKSEAWQCSACFHMMESSAWKLAYEKRIPFIISGRTPEQILRRPERTIMNYIRDTMTSGFSGEEQEKILQAAQLAMDRIRNAREWFLKDPSTRKIAQDSIYLEEDYVLPADFAPTFIPFFLFEEHNEKRIIEELEQKTDWKSPDKFEPLSHADCLAHDAATFLIHKAYGMTILEDEVRALVRMQKISFTQGEALIGKERGSLRKIPIESLSVLANMSGLSVSRLIILAYTKKLSKGVQRFIHRK